jgi:hypothetical protein
MRESSQVDEALPKPEVLHWSAGRPAASLSTALFTHAEILDALEWVPHGSANRISGPLAKRV